MIYITYVEIEPAVLKEIPPTPVLLDSLHWLIGLSEKKWAAPLSQ